MLQSTKCYRAGISTTWTGMALCRGGWGWTLRVESECSLVFGAIVCSTHVNFFLIVNDKSFKLLILPEHRLVLVVQNDV
jgi:hypothetical protein